MADPSVRRKFEALVAAAFADGFLADSERVVLRQKADRMGISPREMQEILGLGQQRKLSIAVPATTSERETLLEDLIDVAVADGRVEAPEYSLLARFAEALKISLPELRKRVNRRMQGDAGRNTKAQTKRELPPPPPAVAPRPAQASGAFPSPAPGTVPILPGPPPMAAHQEFPREPKVGDLPPVTLQLLKQSIMFDNEPDSVSAIARTLGIPPESAAEIRRAILGAFPDLKPASLGIRATLRP